MTRPRSLSHRQRLAIEALVEGQSKSEACVAAGVQPCTLSRWMRDSLFKAALAEAQGEVLGDVSRRMASGACDMLAVLESIAKDKTLQAGVRARAALGWLSQLWKAEELYELAQRVAAIEERLEVADAVREQNRQGRASG